MASLSPERLQQIDALFEEALARPADERTAFLDHACDAALRPQVEALLRAEAEAEAVLGESVTDYAAALWPDLEAALHAASERDGEPLRVGAYRLLKEIGRGGMGAVYLAERADEQFRQRVALKLVKRGMDTEEVLRRFRYERQILAGLHHPHIAHLHDGGATDDGRPYLVMEYVEGLPIDRFCDERTLTVAERLTVFQTVCQAVHYAHQNLVVHRDLKPSNILVSDDGQVKLLDFGIAKLLADDGPAAPLTKTGVRLMTPEYAAPEQIKDEPVTTATDVYALGVVLYELLTGHRPYDVTGTPPHEAERLILEADPERPSTTVTRETTHRRRDGMTKTQTPAQLGAARATSAERLQRQLKGDLDTIVLKALKKEPARRYASAEAFAEDIKRYLAGQPVQARPDAAGYRLRKFVQRNKAGVAVAAAFVVLLLGFAGAMAWQQAATARERDRARLEAAKLTEVRDFLVTLFAEADPAQSRGQPPTALDLLDAGTRRIDHLDDHPEIQATLMATLGDVYRELGDNHRAKTLLEHALARRRTLYGDQHPDVASSLYTLGQVYYNLGNYEDAQRLIKESLSIRQRLLDAPHPDIAQSLNGLAMLRYAKGDYEEAEPLFREALSMYRTLYGDDHPEVAKILNNLASLAYATGSYNDAERLGRTALAIRRKILGDPHPDLAISLGNLAFLTYSNGDLDAAERLYRETLQMRRKLFGDEHPDIARGLHDLAVVLGNGGRYDEAAPLFQQALSMRKKLLGPEHLDIAKTLGELASVADAQGRPTDAEALYREALDMLARTMPDDYPRTALLRIEFGNVLAAQGRYEEAEGLLLTGYETLNTRGQATQRVRDDLIALYKAWGKPDKATAYKTADDDGP